jgi:hypothetical protein
MNKHINNGRKDFDFLAMRPSGAFMGVVGSDYENNPGEVVLGPGTWCLRVRSMKGSRSPYFIHSNRLSLKERARVKVVEKDNDWKIELVEYVRDEIQTELL